MQNGSHLWGNWQDHHILNNSNLFRPKASENSELLATKRGLVKLPTFHVSHKRCTCLVSDLIGTKARKSQLI